MGINHYITAAAWGQAVLLYHIAKHMTNQEPYCAVSNHMFSSKIEYFQVLLSKDVVSD